MNPLPSILKLRRRKARELGFTLTEVLVVVLLLGVVFVGTTGVYVSANRLLKKNIDSGSTLDSFLGLEQLVRRMGLANDVTSITVESAAYDRIQLRWDYSEYNLPLKTPSDFSDDYALKYAVINERLRFRSDPPAQAATAVSNTDPELVPGLIVKELKFERAKDAANNDDFNRVKIKLKALSTDGLTIKTYQTTVLLQHRRQKL